MNILVMSQDGDLLGIADRLVREGNVVRVFSHTLMLSGRGTYELVSQEDLFSAIKECTFIISDMVVKEGFYKRVMMYNKPIIGISSYSDKVNKDCIKEYAIFKEYDVPTPDTRLIKSFQEIYEILLDWKMPSLDIRYDRKHYNGLHSEFMSWAVTKIPPGKLIMMQEPIKGNATVRVIGLFNGYEFLNPMFVTNWNNAENKHAVVSSLELKSQLGGETITRLAKWLKLVDYRGPVSLKVTFSDTKIYVKEIYVGFTYPDIYAILESAQCEVGVLMNALAFGIVPDFKCHGNFSAAICALAKEPKEMSGAPIVALSDGSQLDHIYPIGIMKSDVTKDDYFVSGELETVYVATAYGRSIDVVKSRVMRTIMNTEFPDYQYNPHLTLSSKVSFTALQERNFISA